MSLKVGMVTTVAVQSANMAYGLVLPRVLIVAFGSEVNGLVAGALQIVSLLALLEAGLSAASIRQLYAPIEQNDVALVDRLLGSVRYYYLRVAGWVSCVGLIASALYALVVPSSESFLFVCTMTILVVAGPTMDFALTSKYFVYYVASQAAAKFQLAQLASTIFKIVIVLGSDFLGLGVHIILSLVAGSVLLKWILLWTMFRHGSHQFDATGPHLAVDQRHAVFGHQLLGAVVYSGPVLCVAVFVDTTAASRYSLNAMIFGLSYVFVSMLTGQVVVPRLGHLLVGGNLLGAQSLFNSMSRWVGIGAFSIMSATVILLPSFLILYLGKVGAGYYVWAEASLFALWGFVNLTKSVQQAMVNAAGLFRETLWISVLEVVVFFGVLLIGVGRLSVAWVLLALLLSCFTKLLSLGMVVGRRVVRASVDAVVAPALCFLGIIFICLQPFRVHAESVLDWALQSVVVVFVLGIGGWLAAAVAIAIGKFFQLLASRTTRSH